VHSVEYASMVQTLTKLAFGAVMRAPSIRANAGGLAGLKPFFNMPNFSSIQPQLSKLRATGTVGGIKSPSGGLVG
jgi:hypothetical protein